MTGRIEVTAEDRNVRSPAAPERDEDLVQHLRAGDSAALEALVQRYSGLVGRLISSLTDDPHLTPDLVQETFLRAWRGAVGYRGGEVSAWLGRIAVNVARDQERCGWLRRVTLMAEPLAEALPDDEGPEVIVLRREEAERVRQALARLPAGQAEAVRLRFLAGESYVTMGELTGLPESTLRSRVKVALARLREELA
ncbi:MAG: sigma-70 family RNA polymerase sigma factor [Armatimonadetes bacterium]|nr:sigma-70 family RNA polymerase sigma factor [Armatimonadota bacterium]